MLTIVVPGDQEVFDESTKQFGTEGDVVLELEHSLLSLSKWESIHEKPFLDKTDKTQEEVLDYIKAMVLTPNVPDEIFFRFSEANFEAINDYINAKRTATWFSDDPLAPKNKEIITSELIYYWMTGYQIPFECETWHLNRLFTLIRICGLKQSKPRKMSRNEIAQRNRELNARRKAELGTQG